MPRRRRAPLCRRRIVACAATAALAGSAALLLGRAAEGGIEEEAEGRAVAAAGGAAAAVGIGGRIGGGSGDAEKEGGGDEEEKKKGKYNDSDKGAERKKDEEATKEQKRSKGQQQQQKKKKKKKKKGQKNHKQESKKADASQSPEVFHQVFTTGDSTISTLNTRSMESVFHIYPDAHLRLYHNQNRTMSRSHKRLGPLLDAYPGIELVPYDPRDVLRTALEASAGRPHAVDPELAGDFLDRIADLALEKYWFSNEANLLRLCLLYTDGGTYMDTDVVVVRPFPADMDDAASGGAKGRSIHNAVLRFREPGSVFISAAINNFLENYDGLTWGNNGPSVFRRTASAHPELVCRGDGQHNLTRAEGTVAGGAGGRPDCWLTIWPAEVFAPVGWRDWEDACAVPGESPVGRDADRLARDSIAVHMNNQMTGPLLRDTGFVSGSLCDKLLNDYCVVCS